MSEQAKNTYATVLCLALLIGLLILGWHMIPTAAPAQPQPQQDCVQVALPDRGLPPCEGDRPEVKGKEVNV